jgi:Tfp pilus assembly protein PilF
LIKANGSCPTNQGEDIKTAMYRFNQAYLLDSTNSDIYWGYGSVYVTLGDLDRGKQQYEQGLAVDPTNFRILTDYGTAFLMEFYQNSSKKGAEKYLDSAIIYMTQSYKIDPSNQNTTFKLSICYWNKGDCNNAWKFYNECKKYGDGPITDDYTKALTDKCKLTDQ